MYVINLYLFGISALFIDATITLEASGHVTEERMQMVGSQLFNVILACTTLAAIVAVSFAAAFRLAPDRINEEMQFYSLLTPRKLLIGRLQSGMFLTVLFYTMMMPYLSLVFVWGKVDWLWLIFSLINSFIGVQVVNLIAVAMFAGARSVAQAACYGVIYLILLCCWFAFALPETLSDIFNYIAFHLGTPMMSTAMSTTTTMSPQNSTIYDIILILQYCIIYIIATIIVSFVAWRIAICHLSPIAWNRMMPIRLSFSVLAMLFWLYFQCFDQGGIGMWYHGMTFCLALFLIVAVCERDTWEARLRLQIPKSRFWRIVLFPIYTGAANAMMFVLVWTIILGLIVSFDAVFCGTSYFRGGYHYDYYSVHHFIRYHGIFEFFRESIENFTPLTLVNDMFFLMLIFDYFVTGKYLWGKFFWRTLPKDLTWLIGTGLVLTGIVLSFLLAFLLDTTFFNSGFRNTFALALNPFMLFIDEQMTGVQMILASVWTIAIILFGYPWLRDRFRDFHR